MIKTKDLHMQIQESIAVEADAAEHGKISYLDAFINIRFNRSKMEETLLLIKDWEKENQTEIEYEVQKHPEGYRGKEFEIRGGRKMFSFKGIPEWEEATSFKKDVEEKYKAMFHAKMKGLEYANTSADGEILPLPEISYGKGSIVLKNKKV